jgi:ribonuclease PH
LSRTSGRAPEALRPLSFLVDAAPYAEGSCLVSAGNTRVLCTASVSEEVPAWRGASGKGWVTAEYAMLPRATHTRTERERSGPRGRTQEIQRLIGRSLRAVIDLGALGPRTITVDCDVLQADGGTRTASITGGWVALHRACARLLAEGRVAAQPVQDQVAAVSVGLVDGRALLDLDYREDAGAQVDMNVVATGSGRLVEVQGTAERHTFTREEMDALLDLALAGIRELMAGQAGALG